MNKLDNLTNLTSIASNIIKRYLLRLCLVATLWSLLVFTRERLLHHVESCACAYELKAWGALCLLQNRVTMTTKVSKRTM